MNLFTSNREKCLWICTIVVLSTIYITSCFAPALVNLIPNRTIIDNLFLFGMLLIVVSAVILAIRNSKSNEEIGVGIGIVAVYLLIFIRMNIPEERSHLIEYGIVALLVDEALKVRKENGGKVLFPGFLAIIIAALAGVMDEIIQLFIPNRVFDIRDIYFNILAGVLAIASTRILSWVKRKMGS